MEAKIAPMRVTALVLATLLIESLKLASGDVADDPGGAIPLLDVVQDAVQPGQHLPRVRHV